MNCEKQVMMTQKALAVLVEAEAMAELRVLRSHDGPQSGIRSTVITIKANNNNKG
jgi:hypothetical protein